VKVYVQGQGEIRISKADYVGGGGEGNVYVKGSTAIKIYNDRNKMIPTGKVRELAAIQDPCIITPERIVSNKNGQPIGYTMRFLKGALPMCQLFPPVFRQRNNLTPQMTVLVVQSLQERVANTHKAGILVVDLNEMNYLVSRSFDEVYAIDVDSYQTPHYAATAIMPSIRDPQVQMVDFTQLSDWFSFAIVSFNLFTGIHPYKGKHPSIKGLENRMQAQASVFNPDVKVPRVVYPFDVIPDVYRQWYKAVLEDGKRLPPPGSLQGTIVVAPVVRVVGGTDQLDLVDLFDLGSPVRGLWEHQGAILSWTEDGVYLDRRRMCGEVKGIAGVGFSPKVGRPVIAGMSGGRLKLLDVESKTEIPVTLRADAVMSYDGNIYLQSRDKILEIVLNDVGGRVLASTRIAATCLEHATHLFPGVVVQDLLGATWVSMFPEKGKTYQTAVPELDEYRVVDAKFDRGVLMVIGVKQGQYDRLVFRFAHSYDAYDVRMIEDVGATGLNFVSLDSGVCVCMTEEEKLELFSARRGSTAVKVIDDPVLGGDMHLYRQGGRIVFPRGSQVYAMRMH